MNTFRIQVLDKVPTFTAKTVTGEEININQFKGKKVHLAFHRYASCPICNLTIRAFQKRYQDLKQAGIVYLPVFHSTPEKMRSYYPELPKFQIITDPDMKLYAMFGVKSSWMGYLSPRSGINLLKSFLTDFKKRLDVDGETSTMPADFLIDEKGKVRAFKHGSFIGDSWSVDDVLKYAY